MDHVAAVAFDIDHTLAIDNKLERVAFLHLLEEIVREGGRALGSLAEESLAIDGLLRRQRGGACSIDDAVAGFVAERGGRPSPAHAERFRRLALAMVDHFVVPATDAEPTLRELSRRGYALAVLSNGWSPLQERKARRAGYVGPVLASGDLGYEKPDARCFLALAESLGLAPKEILYVGDDPRADIAGALGAGLQAAWLDAEGVTYPPDIARPTVRIGSLGELPAVLPAIAPTRQTTEAT